MKKKLTTRLVLSKETLRTLNSTHALGVDLPLKTETCQGKACED